MTMNVSGSTRRGLLAGVLMSAFAGTGLMPGRGTSRRMLRDDMDSGDPQPQTEAGMPLAGDPRGAHDRADAERISEASATGQRRQIANSSRSVDQPGSSVDDTDDGGGSGRAPPKMPAPPVNPGRTNPLNQGPPKTLPKGTQGQT